MLAHLIAGHTERTARNSCSTEIVCLQAVPNVNGPEAHVQGHCCELEWSTGSSSFHHATANWIARWRALSQRLTRPLDQVHLGTPGYEGTHGTEIDIAMSVVNNCAHTLVVLVLCIFGTCRAFFLAEVFLTRCLFVKFSCAPVFVCFKGP